jgi:hypothetical protein
VTDAGEDDKPRRGDRGAKALGDVERSAHIVAAVEEQRGHVDPGQDVAQVHLGHRARHGPEPWRMESGRAGRERLDGLRRRPLREQGGDDLADESIGRQVGQLEDLTQAPFERTEPPQRTGSG